MASLIFLSQLSPARAGGFGKAQWGMSKNEVQEALNVEMSGSYYAPAILPFLALMSPPSGYEAFEAKYKLFGEDFTGFFIFDPEGGLSQVAMRFEAEGGIGVVTRGQKIVAEFEKSFTRQYGSVYKETADPFAVLASKTKMLHTMKEWLKDDTLAQLGTYNKFVEPYEYKVEATWRKETSPF